jgi:hypothetical protein
VWVLGCAISVTVGCGGVSTKSAPMSAGGATGAGPSGASGATTMPPAGMTGGGGELGPRVQPPSNVDLETCAHAEGAGEECFFCCIEQDFPYMGDFEGKCVCSSPVEGNGALACAPEAANDACAACCDNAGFKSWRNDMDPPEPCLCFNHSNPTVCADTSSDPTPQDACAVCCINAGYVSRCVCLSG